MAFFVIDPVRRCIGLAHAGWRGALGRIGAKVVSALTEQFGSNPAALVVGVGPSISPNALMLGKMLRRSSSGRFQVPCVWICAGGGHVDLWMVAGINFLKARFTVAYFASGFHNGNVRASTSPGMTRKNRRIGDIFAYTAIRGVS
jgi:hypothetical protein